jgi:hypothetical protein
MGTYRLLLTLLSLFVPVLAQQPGTNSLTLDGVVVNSVTGRPVPRALVQINFQKAVLSGPEGEFSFADVQPGSVTIGVSKPGFFGPGTTMKNTPGMVQVMVSADSHSVVLKLAPEAVIWGHVSGRDDDALEGALVQVLAPRNNGGIRQLFPEVTATTDEDGNYRIAGLAAGRYFIALRANYSERRILGARSSKSDETYAPIYYPAGSNLASATAVDLASGQHLEASFNLAPVAGVRVSGSISSSGEWKQISPPTIMDSTGQVLFTVDKWEAGSSSFEFHAVPPGSYTLRASARDMLDHTVFSEQALVVSRPITGLKVALRPGIEIPVDVQAEFTKPRQNCSMTLSLPGGGSRHSDCTDVPAAYVELIGMDSNHQHYSTDYSAQTGPSGYMLHSISPGKYMVRARASFGGYVLSVRCGNLDLLREPLVVPETGSVGGIEVTVRDDGATVRLQVAGNALEQGLVLLIPDGQLLSEPRAISHWRGSTIQLGPVAPGIYKIFAFDSSNGIDYGNPEVLARYSSQATTIRVGANDETSVAVDVIHVGD